MKCLNCFNNLISSYRCIYCQNNFCSLSCLEMHCSKNHNEINNKNDSSLKKGNKISSPFLVKGVLNNTIVYEPIYSLKNFVPVYEPDGKLKVIGSGSYGEVFLGLNIIDKKYYAIKHMDKKNIYNLLNSLTGIQKEIEIQSKIDHPNIVKLLFVKETDTSYDLIMEYAQGGNLFHFIRKNKGLNEDKTFSLFIQVVNAVNFLNENDLIHRDIKPENILLFDNNIVKLCDFGWCVKLDGHQRETFCGTTEYMSPELVKNQGYGKEIDVWSLGILLYEMIHGYSPFRPNKPIFDEKDVIENIINHNLTFGKEVSDECKTLIYGLLEPDISKRYKVEDIYNSDFIKRYENNQINSDTINSNDKQIFKSQVNNIFNSPQIEMKNNINIHMSMDLKNYVYNIQLHEIKNDDNFLETNNIKPRNKSFPKINRGVYTNYINSVNNNGIYNSNYYINNNLNNLMNDNEALNQINNINNYVVNNFNKDNNININNENLLISNKTGYNFYPLDIEKNREQNLINLYSGYNNNIIPEDTKRDNINFINFNNSSLFNFGQNNSIFVNKINQINNNKNIQTISNSNSQINNSSNSHYFQISGISGIKESQNNNTVLSNIQDIINNATNSISTIQKVDINNANYNYYNNSNDFNFTSLISNINNSNYYPTKSSLIKRTELDLNDNNNTKLNTKISFNRSNSNDNIKKLPKVLIPLKGNISGNKRQKINKSLNKNLGKSKSGVFKNLKKITKITELDKNNESKLNIKNESEDNSKTKMRINSHDSQSFNDRNNHLNKSNYFSLNKNKKNTERLIKEKEPIDNMQKRNKTQKGKENIKINEVNKNFGNINKDSNNNINCRSIKKNEKLIKIKEDENKKSKNILQNKNFDNNEINNTKIINVKINKHISFDQPTEIIPTKSNESNKLSKLISSNSYYDEIKNNKKKNKTRNNIMPNTERNGKINKTYEKINNKDKNELYNQKITKYIYKKSIQLKSKENDIDYNSIKKKIDLKNNKIINKENKIRPTNNKRSAEQILLSALNEKKPKNNKKNKINKKNQNIINNNNKIKLQKNNKIEIKNNFIGLCPNLKPFYYNYNITNNNFYSTNNTNKKNNKNIQVSLENSNIGNNMNNNYKLNKSNNEQLSPKSSRINLANRNNNANYLEKEIANTFRKENQKIFLFSNSSNNFFDSGKMKNSNMNMNINKIKNGKKNKIKESHISKINKNNEKLNKKTGITPINDIKLNVINNILDNSDKNDELNLTPKKKSIFSKIKPNKLLEAFRRELANCSKKETISKITKNNK